MKKRSAELALLAGMVCTAAVGADFCTSGIADAVPVKDGKAPVIDGRLDDWDLSGEEVCWIADLLAEEQNCKLNFMYDDAALYVGVRMALYDHEYTNENRPGDRYWHGDLIQLRYSTDKSLPFPLPGKYTDGRTRKLAPCYVDNARVGTVNLWRDTKNGRDSLFVTPGADFQLPATLNPDGSAIKVVTGPKSCTMEVRIPWSVLGCPDGKNPFKPGEKMAACVDVKWLPGTDGHYTAIVYNKDPGAFAFLNPGPWGQIRFAEKGNLKPHGKSMAAVAKAAREAAAQAAQAGATPIRFTIPKKAFVSVNIVDEKGAVVKELMGGEPHEAGEVTAYWDGRDQYGFPLETGRDYAWKAYLNDGVDVEYFGTVGTEGVPPYETTDGKGGWGGDHGPCTAAATDATGRYFIWLMSESGKALVKTDFDGNVIWRSSPFVCGGYGAYTAGAVIGDRLYLVFNDTKIRHLVQIDTATGNYEDFPGNRHSVDLGFVAAPTDLPAGASFHGCDVATVGLATDGKLLFVANTTDGLVEAYDPKAGAKTEGAAFKVPFVRGLAWHDGLLYAAAADGKVWTVDPANGETRTVVAEGLSSPHSIAFDPEGRMHVSDLGTSHQLKTFEHSDGFLGFGGGWKLVRTLGKAGGRGFLGKYDPDSFLYPASLACDRTGMLIVPELSAPKVFSLIDAKTGVTKRRYFGYTAYSPSNIPDCDDPLTEYYSISGPDGFARATIPAKGGIGSPDASWDFKGAGRPEFGSVFNTMTMGEVVKAVNGRKYLVPDGDSGYRDLNKTCPRTICLIDGDTLRPVVTVLLVEKKEKRQKFQDIEIWSDLNGNGLIDADEKQLFSGLGEERYTWHIKNGSVYMDAACNLYLCTQQNKVLEFPSAGFTAAGVPKFDVKRARVAIPKIVPDADKLFCTWREGLVGLRKDSAGNFYAVVAWNPKYASEAFTKKMHTGMGHTSRFTATKFIKYGPDGQIIWQAGRKATAAPKPGEILHFWCIAGLIGDEYVVCGSEWGPFWIYTKDGFYAGQLFDTPGMPGRGIPYKFGGEDFSGAIRSFPARDEVWAYNAGHTFRVKGFKGGRIKGELRFGGTVRLESVKPLDDGEETVAALENGKEVAFRQGFGSVTATKGKDAITFAFKVKDETPLVNVAKSLDQVFKSGDAVGFELGPKDPKAPRELPERSGDRVWKGYARVLAALIGGKPTVIGMKPFTTGEKRPQNYTTPAGGSVDYQWFGEIPGATATFKKDADGKGYSASVSVPYAFFETDVKGGSAAEAEILLSGEGGRGLGTVRRIYLYSPDGSQTTMVDDTPTEARMYPAGWGELK